tara:strand:+ start:123520 stop:129108 length:5589 start_codon:yes stop_codon:yes gene_type:complete
MLVFLVGCLGGGSKKTKNPDCASGQVFDTVSRSCQGAVVTQSPPVATLASFSLVEDSAATAITLTYSDVNSDNAFSCSVTDLDTNLYLPNPLPLCSCTGGVCQVILTPTPDYNGPADFKYTVTDDDGVSNTKYVSVTISSVNDTPVTTNAAITVDEDSTVATTSLDLTVVAGQVTTAGSFSDLHGGAANENNTPLEFTILTDPKSNASIVSSTGIFTYIPDADDELASGDTIVIGVRDSVQVATGDTNYSTITVTVNQGALNADAPTADSSSVSGSFTEDTAFSFNAANGQLTGTELDSAEFTDTFTCTIDPSVSDVFQTGNCTCTSTLGALLCDVPVRPKENVDATSTPVVSYQIHDTTGATASSTAKTFNITLASVDDRPIAHSTVDGQQPTVDFLEPAGPAPSGAISFSIDQGWDEAPASLTYAVSSSPTGGVLSGCTTTAGVFSCSYTANSGNLQNSATPTFAQYLQGDLQIDSIIGGPEGNNIDITILDAPNIGTNPQIIIDPLNGEDITIYVDNDGASTLPTHVGTAIAAHPVAKNLVVVTVLGATPVVAQASTAMAGGNATNPYADSFTYTASDGVSTSITQTVYIDITGTNDKPLICNYSTYSDLNACGGNGCLGTTDPINAITPSTHTAAKPIIYFNNSDGVCWKTTGTTSADWEIVDNATEPSYIQDIVVNEGEGTIVVDNIGVDEGGAGSEDTDTLGVTSITSDNAILVPGGNISVFFNDTAQTVGAMPGSAFGGATSEGDGDFRLEITPQVGNVGTANITITLEDLSGATSTYTFAVTVQPYSAIHNGWKNITAVGPKFNKFDELKDTNKNVCSYNLDKCNSGQSCTKATIGQSDPNGTVTADADDVLYYNKDTDKCYHAATAGTTWTEVSTYCAVTPTNLNINCKTLDAGTDVASCISGSAPTINATALNQYFWDATNSLCYRSIATGTGAADWETYNATAEVTIEWEDFDVVPAGESIINYEVYRRLANEQFDYTQRLNREAIDDNVKTFTDNAINSMFPPVPGTVYYYEVRPIIQPNNGTDQTLSTNTDEVFKTLRVTAPPDNMVFVHRWMVNKTMCEKIHSTTIDPNNNYRCRYEGPGDLGAEPRRTIASPVPLPDSNYYDIKYDMLVDRYEAGCNYNSAPTCTGTSDGACVGINDPTTDAIDGGANGVIYYARSVGKCYVSSGGGTTWSEIDGNTSITDYVKAHLPPIVNVTQTNAHNFCASEVAPSVLGLSFNTAATSSNCEFTKGLCSGSDCSGNPDPNAGGVTAPIGSVYFDIDSTNCFYNVNGSDWSLSGCNVSKGACAGSDCVGAGAPGMVAKLGSTYYDTTGLSCYQNTDGATTWALVTTGQRLAKVLPTRKEQMAYGLWDTENNTDSAIATLETGLSLNSSAKCNSSQASGLSTNYSDVPVPDSNTFYTLPGTATSNIRSMMTGSDETNQCISRFGVQDHVGNVAEWTAERFNCRDTVVNCPFSVNACDTTDSQCTAASDPNGSVTAPIGTYFRDTGNSICWINADDSTEWTPAHCGYDRDGCDTGDTRCIGTATPNGTVTAGQGTLFWDSAARTCYENTNSGTAWTAVDFSADLRFGAANCKARINGETDALAATTNDMRYGDGTDQWFQTYVLDGRVGPCVDSNSDNACDGNIDSWSLEDERNNAGRYIIPMGLPVVTQFNSLFTASNILDFLFEIGPTNGITSTQLRDDIITIDSATIAGETSGCGGVATGGSYLDGVGAGVYNMELLPCTDSIKSRITVGDVTIVQRGAVTPNLEFVQNGARTDENIAVANAGTGQIQVELRFDGSNVTSTPASIVQAINSDAGASAMVFAFISGDAQETQSSTAQTNFTETEKSSAMIDVGFRCVVPISGYQE